MTVINELVATLMGPVTRALVHFVWQGNVVALGLSLVLGLQRHSTAVVRYRSACVALLLLVALPIATALTYDAPPAPALQRSSTVASGTSTTAMSPTPAEVNVATEGKGSDFGAALSSLLPTLDRLRPWAFGMWLAGVLILSLVHVFGWRRVQTLKTRDVEAAPPEWVESAASLCRCLGIDRAVGVVKSACVEVPTVIGWISPVVLIPASAFTGLTADELRDILVHELAHVKRRDYLINMLQVVAETLLFFHPAVWWVSRRIRIEREHCCDDVVVSMSDDRLSYAKALLRLEELRTSPPQLAMRADGGSLASRIRRLAGGNTMSTSHNRPLLAGVFLASLLIVGGAAISLAIDRPGMGDKKADPAEVAESYAAAEKDFETEGKWKIERYGGVPVLQVRVRERGNRLNMTIEFDENEITGLDYGEDDEFVLARDAGTFYFVGDFEGKGKNLEGDGRFGFVPNSDFEDKVNGNFNEQELLILAAKDVGFEFIEKMEKMGYDIDDGDDLVPLAIHGVSLDYIVDIRESGYDVSLRELVKFRIHGVDVEYVNEMAELGYDHVSADELVKWRIHGVDPEYVHEMHEHGYDHVSSDELVKWRIHGVSPEFVKALDELGYERVDEDDLVRMRIHGVSSEYIRALDELGYKDVDVDDLVRMRIHGVSTSYIKRVLDKTKEPPDVDDLIKMKIHGIYH